MTFEVQQTRWDRIIRRVSGSIGPGSRVSETLSELFPVVDVENVPAELLALGGTRMAIGNSNEPAVAAVFQISELFNPVGSNAIITLLHLNVISTSALSVGMGITDGSFTNNNPANVSFADGRFLPPTVPVGQVRDETAGAEGVRFYLLDQNNFQSEIFQPPKAIAVLVPGTGWSVGTTVVNHPLSVSYGWLERPAEESELNL